MRTVEGVRDFEFFDLAILLPEDLGHLSHNLPVATDHDLSGTVEARDIDRISLLIRMPRIVGETFQSSFSLLILMVSIT